MNHIGMNCKGDYNSETTVMKFALFLSQTNNWHPNENTTQWELCLYLGIFSIKYSESSCKLGWLWGPSETLECEWSIASAIFVLACSRFVTLAVNSNGFYLMGPGWIMSEHPPWGPNAIGIDISMHYRSLRYNSPEIKAGHYIPLFLWNVISDSYPNFITGSLAKQLRKLGDTAINN